MTDARAPVPGSPAQRREAAAASRAARTRRLLEAPIGSTLARLSAPNMLTTFVAAAVSIAEAWYAGRLGTSALAGVALVFPFVMLTQMLSNGSMGGAMSAAVARALGAGDVRRAERLILHAWVIAIGFAAGSYVLMALFGEPLFRLLGGRNAALEAALAYAAVYFAGCSAQWLCNSMISVMRGVGDMMTPSLLMVGISVVIVPLAGALSLGWGPFPALGVAGLAAGQVVAYALGALIGLAYIAGGRTGLSLRGAFRGLERALFRDILRVGIPACAASAQTVLNIVIMLGIVGSYGETALAGYGLGTRLEFLMTPICFGIGAAMTAMVGANIGAGARERALRTAWTGACTAAAIVGGIGLFFAIWPDLWLGIFLSPEQAETWAAGRAYLSTVGPFYSVFAIGLSLFFASQGAARVLWPLIGSLARLIVVAGSGTLAASLGAPLWLVFAAAGAGMLVYGGIIAASVKITGWR